MKYKFHVHPIIKLGLFIGMNFLAFLPLFLSWRWVIFGIEILLMISLKYSWKGIKGFAKILVLNFLVLFLLFYFATWNWLDALREFASFAFTLLIMIQTTFLFTYTTPPMELVVTLRKLKIPTKIIFAGVIALSWLPLLTREIQNIVIVQKSRGYRIHPFHLGPILIPAILRILDLAINLSISLESRGFS